MDKKINTIYETSNYDQFKRLIGNRKDDEVRGKALMLSIKTFGQLDPISVNEKMEVIDGQARLYALRQLGLPVKYYIEKGYGMEECRQGNIKAKNWLIADFVQSYGEMGSVSYKYLEALKTQSPDTSYGVIVDIIRGKFGTGGGTSNKIIKEGTLTITKEQYEETVRVLDFVKSVARYIPTGGPSVPSYTTALGALYKNPDVDKSRLYKAITTYPTKLLPVTSQEDAFKYLDIVYNYHRSNTLDLQLFYRSELARRSRKGSK